MIPCPLAPKYTRPNTRGSPVMTLIQPVEIGDHCGFVRRRCAFFFETPSGCAILTSFVHGRPLHHIV
jgi:hypothetical protein